MKKAKLLTLETIAENTELTVKELQDIAAQGDTMQIEKIIENTSLLKKYNFNEKVILESHTRFGTPGIKGIWIVKNKALDKAIKTWWKSKNKKGKLALLNKHKALIEDEYMDSLEVYYKETGEIALLLRDSDRPGDLEAYCRYSVDFMLKLDDFLKSKLS